MKRLGIILFGLALLVPQVVSGQMKANPPLVDGSSVVYKFIGVEPGSNGREGPYRAVLPYGSDPTSPMVNLYCVDEGRYVWYNAEVTATVTNLQSGTFTTGMMPSKYGGGTVAQLQMDLQKAAYLSTQFWTTSSANWQAIHYAIWSFTSSRAVEIVTIPAVSDAAYWVNLANANAGGLDYSDWSLLTTTSGVTSNNGTFSSSQSMLVQSVVPEPQTYVLMGTGLLFMVFFGRRRLKEMGYV